MSKFYVYTLAYPEQMGGAVFYVGKGTCDRLYIHEKDALVVKRGASMGKKLRAVLCSILNSGQRPVTTKVFETDDPQAAYDEEYRLFGEYGDQIVNVRRHRQTLYTHWTGRSTVIR